MSIIIQSFYKFSIRNIGQGFGERFVREVRRRFNKKIAVLLAHDFYISWD